MLKNSKFSALFLKATFVVTIILLIAVYAYAQAPEWQWATKAGGYDAEQGNRIYVDNSNNCYVTGYFRGTATFGTYSVTSAGWSDIFVAKMDANGIWQWASRAGGVGDSDRGNAITLDGNGNIYVAGQFSDTADFGSFSLTSYGEYDIFVAKLDQDGNWQWVTKAGGIDSDAGRAMAMIDNENLYITGEFSGTATFGTYSVTASGWADVYVAKIDANGTWQWVVDAGGSAEFDGGYGIAIDDSYNCYVTGVFAGTANFGSYSITSNGWRYDVFVAKTDANGTWQWATDAGSSENDYAKSIALDGAGLPYVIGYFKSTAFFGYMYVTSYGDYDIFVAKMDQNGNWQWVTQAGGPSVDYGYDIATDATGNSYTTGRFKETAIFGTSNVISSGSYDIFAAKIDASGIWQWVVDAGGSGWDEGQGIALDNDVNCYTTGSFQSTANFGTHSLTSTGSTEIFVAKLGAPVSSDPEILPVAFNLSNHPNPFNTNTTIQYSLKQEALVSLEIYNLKGQLVETLLQENIQAGDHTAEWNCQNVPTGMYFLKMKAGNEENTSRMVLMR